MRRYIQYIFLILFIIFIFETEYPLKEYLSINGFLRMDPLIFLGTFISSLNFVNLFIPAIILLIFTLIIGKFFCGYICPMGTIIDISDSIIDKEINKDKERIRLRSLKYYILIVIVISSISGLSLIYLMDPLTIITRFFSYFIYPILISLLNLILYIIKPFAQYLGFFNISHKVYKTPIFGSYIITFVIFGIIISLGFINRRFWCRNLCPLGALLGLISRFSLLNRFVKNGCNDCSICIDNCSINAIDKDPRNTLKDECIRCLKCLSICPNSSVSFKYFSHNTGVDISKRAFLSSVGVGVLLGFSIKRESKMFINRGIIRPPGALPEALFVNRCVRCSLCIKVCVTNTLQPSLFEKGLQGFWTPRLYSRLAGCEQNCNLCGIVCPTKAIRELSLEEKKYAKIGTASLIRERCIVWQQDKLCFICDEACPYGAVYFKPVDGLSRPFVNPYRCNGCGICESRCPVSGESAILITPIGEIRLKDGSYIEEARRQKIRLKEKKDEKLPSGFIF